MKRNARFAVAAVVLSCAGLLQWNISRQAGPAQGGGAELGVPPAQALEQPAAQVVQAAQTAQVVQAADGVRPKMDLVFALDTTSSMSGLIHGAKAKIWEIARLAQEGRPQPELRVGLVAYRDVGDEYVTRVLDLTGDMDKVYATLSGFTASGGGDGPEHVLMGVRDAVEKMPWSLDPRAVKLVYLVGDAPPHRDYKDGITLEGVLASAKEKGIRINAVRCGADRSALEAFLLLAKPTDGEVATIEQSGGVVTAATPFDDELARLNAQLAATEVHYGTKAERDEAASVVERNLAAPRAEQADRAAFYGAGGTGVRGAKKDLVAAPEAAATAAPDELPEALRAMSPDERARFLEDKRKEREAVLAQVRAVSEKRDAFLKSSAPKVAPAEGVASAAPAPAASAFDARVVESMRKAAADKGIVYR